MFNLYFWTVIAFLACLFATMVNGMQASRRSARRPFYILVTMVAAYFTVVYGLALIGILPLRDIGPNWLRGGTIALMGILGGFAIAHWKQS